LEGVFIFFTKKENKFFDKRRRAMESLNRFNQLSYAKHLYTDGRIILVDVPLEQYAKEKMGRLKTVDGKGLVFLETEQLAKDLEQFLEELVKKEKDILFVFPGNFFHGFVSIALGGILCAPFLCVAFLPKKRQNKE